MLRLEVEPERVGKHMNAAVRRVSQRVNVPGFRKGKAPRAILQNFVGKDYLVEEAMGSLVPEVVGEAVEESELTPFATPQVNVEQTEPTVTIVATVPLQPKVDLCDYKSIRYDDQPEDVNDETVETWLTQLRRSQAYTRPVERPAQENDIVMVDLKVTADDEVVWDFKDRQFQLGLDTETYGEFFVDVFRGMIGLSAEESKDYSLDVSEDDENPRVAGKTVNVSVSVQDVREEVLPELDDALAASIGIPGVETADQLKVDVRRQLEEQSERALVASIHNQLVEELIETSEFAISPIVIELESRNVLERYVTQRRAMAAQTGQKFAVEDLTDEDVEEAKTYAEREIKNALVMQSLIDAEGLEIPDDDVIAEIERTNEEAASDDRKLEDNEATRDAVSRYLKRQRTIDKVINLTRGLQDETEPASTSE